MSYNNDGTWNSVERSTTSIDWRQLSARVQFTQEQMANSVNSSGAFIRAAAEEQQRAANDWQRRMTQYTVYGDGVYAGLINHFKPVDPDLELDEGL